MRIAACVGVKNEIEMIRGAIDNLRAIGVDGIAVADLGSTDGTLELLKSMEHEPDFLLLQYDEMDDGFLSARSPQFQRLLSRFNPDWIILSDADERWMTKTGSLRDEPTLRTCDIVVVSRFNVPLTATLEQSIDRLGLDPEVTCDIIVDGPTAAEELFADENDVAWAPTLDGPRVMFRDRRGGALGTGAARGLSRSEQSFDRHRPRRIRGAYTIYDRGPLSSQACECE